MANINLRRFDEARRLIKELDTEDNSISVMLLAKCYCKEGDLKHGLNLLLENYQDSSKWWNEIGIIYWDLGEYKKSFNYFLKVY